LALSIPLVIPKRKIYRGHKGSYEFYVIYIPQDFNNLLPIPAFVSVIYDNETVKVGVRKPFKVGRVKYAVILPKDLAPIWDKIMRENKEVILVLEPISS
jgi:hypothetical protein